MSRNRRRHRFPQDPQAEREPSRYERPIPSREFILEALTAAGVPRSAEQIAEALGLRDPQDRQALARRLEAMVREGQLLRNRRGGYGLPARMDLVSGRVRAHPEGFGFLIPDGGGEDVYLSARQMRSLLHEDRALVRLVGRDRRGRPEGMVVEVLERANHRVVGRYVAEGGVGFVLPDNKRLHQDILIPGHEAAGAHPGQVVVAEITVQPDGRHPPMGRIVEILGEHMAPGMEVDIAIRAFELPSVWPPEVLEEVEGLPLEVSAPERRGRLDLRDLPLVTIDGEDARDFDDAVYCEREAGGGYRLLVAIADVAHYVRPGTALDAEARRRGNSVYFPDRVIPMLPEALANGLCSLNPHVERLCLACELRFDAQGRRQGFRFRKAVMRSHARLTYTEVAAMLLEREPSARRRHRSLLPHLETLYELYRLLRAQRERRGAIDLDTVEARIVYGPDKRIERIVPAVRNDAHRLIEECMIAANIAAAEFLLAHRIPALYRVHEPPAADKVENLRSFLGALGLSLNGGERPQAGDYARLIAASAGRQDAHLIQTVLLRSLKLAVYSPQNVGHFGLALAAYAHFTSPIRRYPDLLVHRAIRHLLERRSPASFPYDPEQLVPLAEHCSMTERRADEATRDVLAWLKCEYMSDKVGQVYEGLISAVTGFGFFVELEDIYAEGLVHVTALPNDYYHFDPVHQRLRGERTGRVFRLGDRLEVRVLRVDLDERRIELGLVGCARRPRGARL